MRKAVPLLSLAGEGSILVTLFQPGFLLRLLSPSRELRRLSRMWLAAETAWAGEYLWASGRDGRYGGGTRGA
jgi:hypothetical protein